MVRQNNQMPRPAGSLLFAADMAGTLLFGIEGAEAAIAGQLDLLGLMVLAFSTAFGGWNFSRSPDWRCAAQFAA
jgi:hypothetical protein